MEKDKSNLTTQNLHAVLNDISFPMNAPTIMSKAWRLYLLNFKDYKYYIIIPLISIMLYVLKTDLLISSHTNEIELFIIRISILACIIIGISIFFITYSQGFYNHLVGKSTQYKSILKDLYKITTSTIYLIISTSIHIVLFPFILIFLINFVIGFAMIALDSNYIIITIMAAIGLILIAIYFVREIIKSFLFIPGLITVVLIEKIPSNAAVKLTRKFINQLKSKSLHLGELIIILSIALLVIPYFIDSFSYFIIDFITDENTYLNIVYTIICLLYIINIFIIMPLIAGSTVLLYMDYKAENEGIDLTIALKEVKNSLED
ncbi:MAG: hypothetical protein AB7V50_07920 [Vampirovibrionia bacterium]